MDPLYTFTALIGLVLITCYPEFFRGVVACWGTLVAWRLLRA